jgi:dTDP-4-dehydrorhamnose 3,5-epimerase
MKIMEVKSLAIPDVKVIRYGRFRDHRGFFGEHFRKSDFSVRVDLGSLRDVEFSQCNESWSKAGTVRGLHFQWNPYMGKLVRTLSGHMVDIVLDIRKNSPTFGKAVCYDMPSPKNADFGEWIWVPVGFAHGNYFPEESHIEYFCSGEYSSGCEAGISPLADDIDWSLCRPELKKELDAFLVNTPLMTDKDINGFTLNAWLANPNSEKFTYNQNA